MRDDDVGLLCKSNEMMLLVGSSLYEQSRRKKDKEIELRSSVRNVMKRLGHLYKHFIDTDNPVVRVFSNAGDEKTSPTLNLQSRLIQLMTKKLRQVSKMH